MKKRSQLSTKNFNFFEKDIVIFDTSYLLKIISISIITTLILIIFWQFTKLISQQQLNTNNQVKSTKITINSSNNFEPQTHEQQVVTKSPSNLSSDALSTEKLEYNVQQRPQLKNSEDLQKIVDQVVNIASNKSLPTTSLSITLIDLKTNEEASYQQEELRYPASVVKLYWLVMLQAQLKQKNTIEDKSLSLELEKMIKKSDNEAASRILDRITKTESGSNLDSEEFKNWLDKREQVNQFFINAGYENLNISQKTFPIPYLKLYSPQGRDLQMRKDINQPIRNKITTKETSRLMYDIVNRQAVTPDKSKQMLDLLSIDTATRINKRYDKNPNTFNSVRGFLSQSLPNDIYFAAKAGWTSELRGETAYIATKDGKTQYILTILAEDSSYAYNWDIFPEISQLVFEQMKNRK
jgi:beta-lactamase class A